MTPTHRYYEIVVAEDNPADLTLVREALRHHQVNCLLHVVRDGEKALALIDKWESDPSAPAIDLLILDLHLPRYNGEDILRRLRSTERYAQTPVLLMTGLEVKQVAVQAASYAALFYFRKPSTLDEFLTLGSVVQHILTPQDAPQPTSAA